MMGAILMRLPLGMDRGDCALDDCPDVFRWRGFGVFVTWGCPIESALTTYVYVLGTYCTWLECTIFVIGLISVSSSSCSIFNGLNITITL